MKKSIIAFLALALVVAAVAAIGFGTTADSTPVENLFYVDAGTAGYTSDEALVLTRDFVSSAKIFVTAGETLWFGPCEPAQYFQLVGLDAEGKAATDKIRGKELEIADTFAKGTVIYKYTVPAGVSSLVFSAPAEVAEVYTVTKTELTELLWRAHWKALGKDTDSFVGQSSYYEVSQGDKLFFGAITESAALESKLYNGSGELAGTMEDITLVESFGGEFGIYSYTVPADVAYVQVNYDADYEQYYHYIKNPADESKVVDTFIDAFGIPRPLASTVEKLSGKSALFVGDSITYGARDRACIYEFGGWAGRIGYFAEMDVRNNGVSGACITTGRVDSHSEQHYIYNNLVSAKGTEYDYVIMHGLFNDASLPAEIGTPQGKASFKAANADVTTFADALELLFYQARQQNPDAILGYIVNFQTERAVDQKPYVDMAIQICKDWGISYLDLYNLEGFAVEFDDGLHPSSAGYDSMYTIVANWMATLEKGTAVTSSSTAVMSYNVYYDADVPGDVGISITDRYLKVAQLIDEEAPDIAVLQEVTADFGAVAANVLDEYGVYGVPHWTNGEEVAAVAWKADKYDLIASGNFAAPGDWCSSTTKYPRTVNYVVLEDKATEKQLLVMSVHGQPNDENEEARNKTMALVAQQAAELSAQYGNIPVIIGGDFNMAVNSDAYNTLISAGMADVCMAVNPTATGTYNAWTRPAAKNFTKGDYLFMLGDVNALTYQVITDDLDAGRTDDAVIHISDHCPIIIKISY